MHQLLVIYVLFTAVMAFVLLLEGRMQLIVGVPLLLVVLQIIDLYLPGFLSYELCLDGVRLRSVLRRRTISYDEIENAIAYTEKPPLGMGLWAYQTTDYAVGLYPSKKFGWVDVFASHYDESAVVLVLKKGRPVLFTPEDPVLAVKLIDSLRKA